MNISTINRENWTGETVTVSWEQKSARHWEGYTADFIVHIHDDEAVIYHRGDTHPALEADVFRDIFTNDYIAQFGGIERGGSNPIFAAVKLAYSII